MPPEIVVSRQEFDELKARQERMEAMLKQLHDALMEVEPGEERTLLQRMASLTKLVEGNVRVAKLALGLLKIGAALAALGVTIKIGILK